MELLYSNYPFDPTTDVALFEDLANIFDPKNRPTDIVNQLTGFDLKRVTIVISMDISALSLDPDERKIEPWRVKYACSTILRYAGPRMLSNAWKVISLPMRARSYDSSMGYRLTKRREAVDQFNGLSANQITQLLQGINRAFGGYDPDYEEPVQPPVEPGYIRLDSGRAVLDLCNGMRRE
jgi:hypothetical protein